MEEEVNRTATSPGLIDLLRPMDYFLWIYLKNKVYVKNYENISDLISAIISAFQEVSDGMVTSTSG